MNTVKVKRQMVLDRIKKNREQHKAAVQEALTGYRESVIVELDRMIEDAKEGRRLETTVKLIQPQNHTREYDQIIDMLENSVEEILELSYSDYRSYVRDEWAWDLQFATSNMPYVRSMEGGAYMLAKAGGHE